jgi:murein DD-endopeptidase MepM/ murein hydrolase activator NlpD
LKLNLFLLSSVLFSVSAVAGSFPSPTSLFGLPFNEKQTGPYCSISGWSNEEASHQYHMQHNFSFDKFHMGEDWNGKCGGDTDEGYPLLAIADGEVVSVDDVGIVTGQGKRLYIRHAFPYAQNTARFMVVESAMLHLQGMGTGIVNGAKVKRGQTIAYLGKTGTGYAHFHWELRSNLFSSTPSTANPYSSVLTIGNALNYLPPSMVVDDRRNVRFLFTNNTSWTNFSPSGNAPSSTMYVNKGGELKTLRSAVEAGWIVPRNIQFKKSDGKWYYYTTNVDAHYFEAGKEYRVMSTLSGVSYGLPIPGNRFQEDRARFDMINAVKDDSRFFSFDTKSFDKLPNWHLDWELYRMEFKLTSGESTWVVQITNKADPLIRQTTYIDPVLNNWTDFIAIDKNKLY